MKIGIDIRSTLKRKTGIGYFTLNLINNLARFDQDNQYLLYSQIGFFNKKKKTPDLPGSNFKHIIDRFNLGPDMVLGRADIFHTQSYDLKKPKGSQLVLVVHDVMHKAYPVGQTEDSLKVIQSGMARMINEARMIIVSSGSTLNDLIRFYHVDPKKARVVYPGINNDFSGNCPQDDASRSLVREKFSLRCPYLLYVGTLEPRKNIEGLIKAYKLLKDRGSLKHQLVIAGMRGWGYQPIFSLVEELKLSQEVIFTDYVSRQELKALYEMADIFVYPSFYEGVGLPVLEAFSFGLPVVTSRTSSLGEVAGNAAVLIDPAIPGEIADGIYRISSDEGFKNGLKDKGRQRVKEFSWEKAIQQTLKVFYECL